MATLKDVIRRNKQLHNMVLDLRRRVEKLEGPQEVLHVKKQLVIGPEEPTAEVAPVRPPKSYHAKVVPLVKNTGIKKVVKKKVAKKR